MRRRRVGAGLVFVLGVVAARGALAQPPPPTYPNEVVWEVFEQTGKSPFVWQTRLLGAVEKEPPPTLAITVNVCSKVSPETMTVTDASGTTNPPPPPITVTRRGAFKTPTCQGDYQLTSFTGPGATRGRPYELKIGAWTGLVAASGPMDAPASRILCTSPEARDGLAVLGEKNHVVLGPDGSPLHAIDSVFDEDDQLAIDLYAAIPYRVLVSGCGAASFYVPLTKVAASDPAKNPWNHYRGPLGKCEGNHAVTVSVDVPDQGGVCGQGTPAFTFRTKRLSWVTVGVGMALSFRKHPLGERNETGLRGAYAGEPAEIFQTARTSPLTPVAFVGGFLGGRSKGAGGVNLMGVVGIPLNRPLSGALAALGYSPVLGVNVLVGVEIAHRETQLAACPPLPTPCGPIVVSPQPTSEPPTTSSWKFGGTGFVALTLDQNLFRWFF